jgi:hypothetical protein
MRLLIPVANTVAFDFWFKHNYGFKIYYASLRSAIFLKEKIKTEKNKKESQ